MVNQQNLVDGVYTKIMSLIGSDVGNRVYEGTGPQDASLPICLFDIVSDSPEPWFGTDSLDADVQVTVFGDRDLGAKAVRTIVDTLVEGLHKVSVDVTGYGYIFCECTNRGVSEATEDVLGIRTEFRIRGAEDTNPSS